MDEMERKRTLGYICPKCGKSVIGERTVFALSAGPAALVCDCGESELISETDGLDFRLTVPCGVCGGEHIAQVEAKRMLSGQGFALSCPERRQLCCCVGERDRVVSALRQLQLAAEKLRERKEDLFADDVIMYEVLSELKDIAARDGISCTCGSHRFRMAAGGGAVDLICQNCGGRLRIGAATDEDLDQLCCRYTLTIRGNQEKNKGDVP